jgi:predicted dehydrogenase
MVKETKPDAVIVTTVDSSHYRYVVRALELGCDAITEKPMCTDEAQCQAIVDAQKKTGRKVTVTFNARHSPKAKKIRSLLMEKAIGDVIAVDFHEYSTPLTEPIISGAGTA